MSDTMSDSEPEDPPRPDPVWPGPFARLRRSDEDRWVAGVAGGLARQFDVQPWVVRLGFVIGTFLGVAIPIYAVAWMTLPSDSGPSFAQRQGWSRNTVIGASIVLAVALALSVGSAPDGWRWSWGWVVPWGLIAAGLWFLFRDRWTQTDGSDRPPAAPPPPPAPPAPPPPPRPPAPPRPQPFLTPLALFAAVLVAGACVAIGGRWDRPGVIASLAVIITGATLVVSAFAGRARALIPVGLAVAIPLVIALSFGDTTWSGGVGDRLVHPTTVAQTESIDAWAVGTTVVDLSGVELPDGRTASSHIEQGVGELRVLLPEDTTVELDATVGLGAIRIDDPAGSTTASSGLDSSDDRTIVVGDGSRHLELDLDLRVGQITVVVPEEATDGPR